MATAKQQPVIPTVSNGQLPASQLPEPTRVKHANFHRGLSTADERTAGVEELECFQKAHKPKTQQIKVDGNGRPISDRNTWMGKHVPPASPQR